MKMPFCISKVVRIFQIMLRERQWQRFCSTSPYLCLSNLKMYRGSGTRKSGHSFEKGEIMGNVDAIVMKY